MKALVLREKDQPLFYGQWPDPKPEQGEALVEIKAAAMNHRDVYITQGLYPGIELPIILGSDGVGISDGQEVIINPGLGWGSNPDFPSKNFTILGLPRNGTFAEYCAVPKEQIFAKPKYLNWEEAAALPLGGLTAYRALFTKGKIQSGKKVLITGIGGGVAQFAFQFALAAGAEVYVTSGSDNKILEAKNLGAAGGASYREENWHKKLKDMAGGFDLIIDSAGGNGFALLVKCCNTGARIVTYGGTRGTVNGLSPQIIFWKQLHILGTSMGSAEEFGKMLDFVSQHKIKPVIDSIHTLAEGNDAFERMQKGLQFGKIVFKVEA